MYCTNLLRNCSDNKNKEKTPYFALKKKQLTKKVNFTTSCLVVLVAGISAPLAQAQNLVTSFDFNGGVVKDNISLKQDYDTGLAAEGSVTFNSEQSISGLGFEVDFLRYLRLPLDVVANSEGKFTLKYDYYHIRSKANDSTAWNSHSFAINDETNGYAWSHGFRNLGNDFWSSTITGFSTEGSQVKGDESLIANFDKNTWHEYVLVFDGNRLSWYVDGIFAYYQDFDTSFADWDFANAGIMLGARYQGGTVNVLDGRDSYLGLTGTNTHLGSVNAIYDNVRMWDSALSAEMIENGVEALIEAAPYLFISSSSEKLTAGGQVFSIDLSTNQAWQVSSLPSWLAVNKVSGDEDSTLTFTLAENSVNEAINATFYINESAIEVTQSAKLSAKTADAVIFTDTEKQEIKYFFYDLKSHYGSTMTESKADQLYILDGFNGVRTSIYGTRDKPDTTNGKPAHPEAGVVIAEYYAAEVSKIKQAMARNPDMIVFASKKLNGQYSFPEWVLQSNGIIPAQYAILLADYIEYMASEGIPTDILGLDNEYVFNEGKIWASRFHDVVEELKQLAVARNFPMPTIIGYEDYGPGKNSWMKNMDSNGWLEDMDIYGTHYYPEDRHDGQITKLESDISFASSKDRWHSELHWNTKADIDDILEIEDGLGSLLDMTDRGFNGLMWWAYSRNSLRGNIMKKLTTNLLGYSPITMIDHDGTNILTDGMLHTRAFRKGNTIRGWILNMNEDNNFENYQFSLDHGTLSNNVYLTQYTEGKPWGAASQAIRETDKAFSLNIAPMSVTTFSFILNKENDAVLLAESWDSAVQENLTTGQILQADNQWLITTNTDKSVSIQQEKMPLTDNALIISAISNTSSVLTSQLNQTVAQGDVDALTLKLRLVFDDDDLSPNDNTVISLASAEGSQLYSLQITSAESEDYIATLVVHGEQGDKSIILGGTDAFIAHVPYDISISLAKTASNQTNVSYAIHRNLMFWSEGETFVDSAIDDAAVFTAITIDAQHKSLLKIDDISLAVKNLTVAPVSITGDINGDGQVTRDDLSAFIAVYGLSSTDEGYLATADLDGDGVISRLDYSQLYSIYRQQ